MRRDVWRSNLINVTTETSASRFTYSLFLLRRREGNENEQTRQADKIFHCVSDSVQILFLGRARTETRSTLPPVHRSGLSKCINFRDCILHRVSMQRFFAPFRSQAALVSILFTNALSYGLHFNFTGGCVPFDGHEWKRAPSIPHNT